MNKKIIFDTLHSGDKNAIKNVILEYEIQCPYDLELYSIKGMYYFILQRYAKAEQILLEGLKINPFNIDLLYNLSLVYEQSGDYFLADRYCRKCLSLLSTNSQNGEYQELTTQLGEKIKLFADKINETATSIAEKDSEKVLAKVEDHLRRSEDDFGFAAAVDWALDHFSYSQGFLRFNSDYYVGNYFRTGVFVEDTMHYKKIEILPVQKKQDGNSEDVIEISERSIVPILLKNSDSLHLRYQEKDYEFLSYSETFSYYPFESDIQILSKDFIIGKPIPLKMDPNKKKLVMTLFIDGLSQTILEKHGFKELMPNTYRFFSNSVYFTDCYSNGDWTYPSIASYYSGLYTTHHKMFTGGGLVTQLPEDTKLLGELLHEKGYVCGKIDGVWRTNPDLGYIRGLSRYIYGKYCEMMSVGEVISETVDHLELFKDTNQYLFITFDELHDIADEYRQRPSTQIKVDLENRQIHHDIKRKTAMLQRDPKKEARYLEQIRFLDRNLSMLYFYLQEHFNEEDLIITLISDHGQSYLLEENDFHMDEKMTKVPLLIKGASKERVYCDECISGVDYIHMMNRICDLGADLSDKDGSLPRYFGGTNPNKYALSESIHANQPYWAALRNEKIEFQFATKEKAEYDGRVRMDEYTAVLKDRKGNPLDDSKIYQECLDFIFDHMKHFRIYE